MFLLMVLLGLFFLLVFILLVLFIGLMLGCKVGFGFINCKIFEEGCIGGGLWFVVIVVILLGFCMFVLCWLLVDSLFVELFVYGFWGLVGGLLVSVGVVVGEEIWFCFGLMILLLYIVSKMCYFVLDIYIILIIIILVVGFGFGLVYIFSVVVYGVNILFVVWVIIGGNVVVVVLYGWCYWCYGLLFVIMVYFSVDVVLYVLLVFM